MASQDFDATTVPQDIISVLNLTAGSAYTCQNVDAISTLRFREAATVPDAIARAHKIEAGGHFTFEPQTGQLIYLWTDDPRGCKVIVTEAV